MGYTGGSATKNDAACAACSAGTYSDREDTTGCKKKSVTKCGVGEGFSEGTASADNAVCAACTAGKFSDLDNTSTCKDKTVTVATCGAGEAYDEGSATSDSASCLDIAPPYLSNVAVDAVTAFSATFMVSSSESGKISWVVVLKDADVLPPLASSLTSGLIAGKISSGSNVPVVAGTAKAVRVTGLGSEQTFMFYVIAEDSSANIMASPNGVAFTTPDGVPPVMSDLRISNITGVGAVLTTSINEDGFLHWAVLVNGAAVPSVSELQAGGALRNKGFGNGISIAANTDMAITITGLVEGTAYTVYFAAEDTSKNTAATVSAQNFLTVLVSQIVAPDTSKPVLSGVSVSGVTDTGCTLFAISDRAGKMHWAVVPASAAAPTVAFIKAGTVAGAEASSTDVVASPFLENAMSIVTLVASTIYKVYIVAEDTALNTISSARMC